MGWRTVAAAIAIAAIDCRCRSTHRRQRGGAEPTAKPPAPPAGPPPRLPNGQINLGAVPGQKGFWNSFNGQLVGKNRQRAADESDDRGSSVPALGKGACTSTATSAMGWTTRTRGASLPAASAF